MRDADQLTLIFSRRHLIRLWLRDPEYAWETPKALEARWEKQYGNVSPDASVFPLEPAIRSVSAGREKLEPLTGTGGY